jgi:hypothetical protein
VLSVCTGAIWSLQQEQLSATIFVLSDSFAASQYRPPPRSTWVVVPNGNTHRVGQAYLSYTSIYYPIHIRRFRKIAKYDYKLRHMFVRPHEKTRLSLGGFSWNLIFQHFSKIGTENSSLISLIKTKIWYFSIFLKSVQKIQVSLKSDKNKNLIFQHISKICPENSSLIKIW